MLHNCSRRLQTVATFRKLSMTSNFGCFAYSLILNAPLMTHPIGSMAFAGLLAPFLQTFSGLFIVAKLVQETFDLAEIREFLFSEKAL